MNDLACTHDLDEAKTWQPDVFASFDVQLPARQELYGAMRASDVGMDHDLLFVRRFRVVGYQEIVYCMSFNLDLEYVIVVRQTESIGLSVV